MRIYDSQSSFEKKPLDPRYKPIDLEGYSIIDLSDKNPYFIKLACSDPSDIRRPWEFRCDTQAELENWSEMISKAKSISL